jgi:hypothetical protein
MASDPSAVVRLIDQSQQLASAQPIFDSGFAAGVEPQHKSRTGIVVAIIAAVLLLGGGAVGLFFFMQKGDDNAGETAGLATDSDTGSDTPTAPAPGGDDSDVPAPGGDLAPVDGDAKAAAAGTADMDTGFDVIVDPQGARIKLDGGDVGPAPRRVRNIAAGEHMLEVEAAGFFAKREKVTVVAGKAETVRIKLDPIEITGRFTSEPPGAKVTLVSNGKKNKLGGAPAQYKLDPRKDYEVIFKKPGYVTVTKPVQISGQPEVNVAVVMERSAIASRDRDRKTGSGSKGSRRGSDSLLDGSSKKKDSGKVAKKDDRGKVDPPKKKDPPAEKKPTGPPASLLIGSKPPCKIYIDGKDTGKKTPQRNMKVKPGKHKITLVNNEFKIKKTIKIDVGPGEQKKIIRDFSDRLK